MDKQTTSTKEWILELLKKNQPLSVAEIAKMIGITEMAVRRHMNTLEKEKLINAEIIRKEMGRPVSMYSLTKEGEEFFPRQYANLTLSILKDIEALSGNEMVKELFTLRKERLKKEYKESLAGKSFEEKVKQLAQIQGQNGYMVEWEKKDNDTIYFKEYNCPIAQIAKEYPIACACEQSLFQELLETENIECEACMATSFTSHCLYKIKIPK